ncbi:hypothetical protein CCR95_18400 [Thiocystis minor]|uniref:hypothetical protein n=1 Tax=Thiocystis minor TaxID=61597 RepID=UPI00191310B6|nr:hypothetical protein [Thiocystis minor]MBK5965993.1 hypothetical protein [Thiocystis minor]
MSATFEDVQVRADAFRHLILRKNKIEEQLSKNNRLIKFYEEIASWRNTLIAQNDDAIEAAEAALYALLDSYELLPVLIDPPLQRQSSLLRTRGAASTTGSLGAKERRGLLDDVSRFFAADAEYSESCS